MRVFKVLGGALSVISFLVGCASSQATADHPGLNSKTPQLSRNLTTRSTTRSSGPMLKPWLRLAKAWSAIGPRSRLR